MKNNHKYDSNPKHKHLNSTMKASRSLHTTKIKGMTNDSSHFQNNLNRTIPIYLFYKKNKIVINVKYGLAYEELKEKLYEQILKLEYEKCENMDQCYRNMERILGFSTHSKNLKEDYMLSIGRGSVTKCLLLECFVGSKKHKNNLFNYQVYNCLAIGGFSKVYLVRSRDDGQFYALKLIKKKNPSDTNASTIINEMKICENLDHPFLVRLVEGFETESFYCMVFEYCPGGELFYLLKRIKSMNEESARFYFIQILLAIEFLHKNLILYRDLKPENILIDWEGNVKIVDFGLSKKISEARQKTYSYCGSAQYMAPEMILRTGHSFSVDHYSLGALLYELVTGLPPFYTKDPMALQESIINEDIHFPRHLSLSPEIRDLLNRLLTKNQKYRLGSYAGMKEIIFHPWVGKFNAEKIINKNAVCPFPPNLYEHNFDEDQLGDDQEEFTAQVYSELQNKKEDIKLQVYCQAKTKKKQISQIFEKIKLSLLDQKRYPKKQSVSHSILKTTNSSLTKLSKAILHKSPSKTSHLKENSSSRNKKQHMIQKLFPYFVKPHKIIKSPVKGIKKKNLFKIGVRHNKVMDETNIYS